MSPSSGSNTNSSEVGHKRIRKDQDLGNGNISSASSTNYKRSRLSGSTVAANLRRPLSRGVEHTTLHDGVYDTDRELANPNDEPDDEEQYSPATPNVECELLHLRIKNTDRPKAGNLAGESRRVLTEAKNEFRARIATVNAYPTMDIMTDWAYDCWANSNKRLYPQKPAFELNDEIQKLVCYFCFSLVNY